ncbi:MAG: hypothetical protein CVU43_07155 [Chloroflexi bacterium HGW-Chloroflexi-5]|jgi:capsular polysaccharide biosynthesis protein|nr:MAG: hypothetical protein CVU43_07155 [Chloroflexi bacterium HGW-Chloroflexi-5]
MNSYENLTKDEIDLRIIIKTLFRARKLISLFTIFLTLLAFITNMWIFPQNFQAVANIVINPPTINYSINEENSSSVLPIEYLGIYFLETIPDLNTITNLATNPSILDSVINDPLVVTAYGNKSISLKKFNSKVSALSDKNNILILQVNDQNAQRAVLLVNTWAEKIIKEVETLYDKKSTEKLLNSTINESYQDYTQKQVSLEKAIGTSQVPVLETQLERMTSDLSITLSDISQTKNILVGLELLEKKLIEKNDNTFISYEDWFSLSILLQQSQSSNALVYSAPTSEPNCSSNLSLFDNSPYEKIKISEAREIIILSRSTLNDNLTLLKENQSQIEQEIPLLMKKIEQNNATLSPLYVNRDNSLNIYSTLLFNQKIRSSLDIRDNYSLGLNKAILTSTIEIPRNILWNTALVGLLSFLIVIFFVLMRDWWNHTNKNFEVIDPQ